MVSGGFFSASVSRDNLLLGTENFRDHEILDESQNVVRGEVMGKKTANGRIVSSLAAASDGSEDVYTIILQDAETGVGETQSVSVLKMGQVNQNALTFGIGHTIANTKENFRDLGIYYQDSSPA